MSAPWTIAPPLHAELARSLADGPDAQLVAARYVLTEFAGRHFADSPVGLAAAFDRLSRHVDAHDYDHVPLPAEAIADLRRILALTSQNSDSASPDSRDN